MTQKKILLSGHSLGAAMSLLTSVHISIHNPSLIMRSYIYGMPRVGNVEFAKHYIRNAHKMGITESWRFVNKRDIVPHVPPELAGFHHPATEIWYWNDSYIQCNGSGEDPNCSDSLDWYDPGDHGTYFNVNMGC